MTRAVAIWLIAFAIAGCAILAPRPEPVEVVAKRSVARLEFASGGTCSGTLVGASVLLTASHCFDGGDDLIAINYVPVNVVRVQEDGADHALVTVDHVFSHWAPIGAMPSQGAPVFFYGNPLRRSDLLRRGYISGDDGAIVYIDITIGPGDSGAGIFNEAGELVGVVTGFGSSDATPQFHIGVVRHFALGFLP